MRKNLWIIALFAVSATVHAEDLTSDARLSQRISVRDKIVSLESFAKEMSDKTHVPILVSPKLLDLKITAICTDRPASELLNRVATLFLFEWQKEKDGYRLVEPPDLARDEKDLLDKETKLSRSSAQAMIAKWMKDSKRPFEEIQSEIESLRREQKELADDNSPRTSKHRIEISDRLRYLEDYDRVRMNYDAGLIFNQLDGKAWDRFWAGKTIIGSTIKDGAPYSLPAEASGNTISMRTSEGLEKPMGGFQFIRFRPIKGIDMQMQAVFKSNVGGGKMLTGFPRFDKASLDVLEDHPFQKRWRAWETPLTDKIPLYVKPFPKEAQSRFLKSPYFNTLVSFADHLEYLADTAGVPIVADAFRVPASFEEEEKPFDNVGMWVARWSKPREIANQTQEAGYFHVEGDWLLYRHADFWDLKLREVSEKVLARMESKEKPTIDDYATFTAALTPDQERGLFNDWWALTRFSDQPIAEAAPALRLWAALSTTQKAEARSAQGISTQNMSPTAQGLYWDAVLESMWRTTILADRVRSALFRGSDPELEQKMRFLLQENRDVFVKPSAPLPDQNGWGTSKATGSRFLFGTDPDSASSFSFQLVPPKRAG